MSLRIIVKPDQIYQWIAERRGMPARRRDHTEGLRILFESPGAQDEPTSFEDLIETMRAQRLVLLVDDEPGKTFHKFVVRG
jgi:hypothetical protein